MKLTLQMQCGLIIWAEKLLQVGTGLVAPTQQIPLQ